MKRYFIGLLVFIFLPLSVLAKGEGSRISGAFGLNIHAHQRIPAELQGELFSVAAENGVQWAREEFIWEDIEPADDAYNWSAYDAVVERYEEKNIEVLGLLTYSTTWSSSQPASSEYEFYKPDMDAWREYVGEAAARYAGRIDHWEIWNEPNLESFWHDSDVDYARLLEVAAEEIHARNPNAKVVFGGMSGSDNTFLNTVLNELDNPSQVIDMIAFHPYREINGNFLYGPERTAPGLNTLLSDITKMKVVMYRHGIENTPIWLTEIGWPTSEEGVSRTQQANFLIRAYTEALSIAGVRKVFWYTFVDDSQQFGLLEDDYEAKESLAAYEFTAQHLDGKRFRRATILGANMLDDFSSSMGWRFGTGECVEGSVRDSYKKRMRVTTQFTQQANCFASLDRRIPLPKNTRVLQFQLKGNNLNALVRMRVTDATGETFQYDVGRVPNEWLRYTVQLSDKAASWGGNNDGKLDQPLQFEAFIVNNQNNKKSSGTIWFDTLESSTKGHTFLYTFKKGKQQTLAAWRSRSSSKRIIVGLKKKHRVRIVRFNKKNRLLNTSKKHRVKVNERMKFLRVLK